MLHQLRTFKLLFYCGILTALLAIQSCESKINKTITFSEVQNDTLFAKAEHLAGSNIALANICLEKGLQSSKNAESPSIRARYQMVKGRILYYNDKYSLSIFYLDSAISYYKAQSNLKRLAKCYMFSAHSNACFGNYPKAIDLCLKAMEINKNLDNTPVLASNYLFAGKLYQEQNDVSKAKGYFNQALVLTKENKKDLRHANVLSSIGMLYKAEGQIDSAEKFIRKANNIQLKCSNIRHLAFTTLHLAEICIIRKEFKQALIYLTEVENIYNELDERLGLVNTYYTYSHAYLGIGNNNVALNYALKSNELACEIESTGLIAKTSMHLSDVYKTKGDFKQALHQYNLFNAYQNELISNEKNRLIKQLESNFEIQQKTNENKILVQKNKIKKQQLTLVTVLASALILLLAASLILFRFKNNNLEHRQKLLSKRKEMADAQLKIHEKETIILKNDLELKNQELAGKTIELLRQNETLQALSNQMQEIENYSCKKEINSIIQQIQLSTRENSWNVFYTAFNNVHKDFYDKLFKICPDLSSTEIKIAALLKLNLSTKEIASISYKTESAIKTSRSRLRSKLKLSQDDKLITYLMQI